MRTYHDGKNIYSVDMMIAYLNTTGHPVTQIPLTEFVPQLEKKVWGEWSPMTVLEKMDTKKYAANAARIHKADLRYPIIVTGSHTIVDGYHRAAATVLKKKTYIDAHVFEPALMKKFIIDRDMNFVRVHQNMTVSDILELWNKRFCTK